MQPTLITQRVAGDHEAFAALYDRLREKLYATAVQLNCTHQEAEDIARDLFVELARHRQELSDVKNLDAYIFAMLRNAVSRLQRRKKLASKRSFNGPLIKLYEIKRTTFQQLFQTTTYPKHSISYQRNNALSLFQKSYPD